MDYRLSDTEFYLKDAGDISYLYMPLVNEKIMSCITPDGHGDSKISQNHFLLEPVSVENLHSSRERIRKKAAYIWGLTGKEQREKKKRQDLRHLYFLFVRQEKKRQKLCW